MDRIRPYRPSDRDNCLRLFDGNVPLFFTVEERSAFADFLTRQGLGGAYQIVERDGEIVGCGGHGVEPDGVTASLCWGMVDRSRHGTGLGRLLTQARLDAARAVRGLMRVRLDTSQHTQGFYARFGFEVEAVIADGDGPGLDRWDMILSL